MQIFYIVFKSRCLVLYIHLCFHLNFVVRVTGIWSINNESTCSHFIIVAKYFQELTNKTKDLNIGFPVSAKVPLTTCKIFNWTFEPFYNQVF